MPLVALSDVQNFARDLIKPINPNFKAGYTWLQKFLARHSLSLRVPNGKSSQKFPRKWEKLAAEFREEALKTIKNESIKPEYVINMDETPLFYEYLPKK